MNIFGGSTWQIIIFKTNTTSSNELSTHSTQTTTKRLGILSLTLLVILLSLLKGRLRDRVETDDRLVGVLDEDILALWQLQGQVDNSLDNTPSVGHLQAHLRSKLLGTADLSSENSVAGSILGVGTRDESV